MITDKHQPCLVVFEHVSSEITFTNSMLLLGRIFIRRAAPPLLEHIGEDWDEPESDTEDIMIVNAIGCFI